MRRRKGFIEMEGKDVEDAIKKALLYLKLPREKVRITVLREASTGLFGLEGKKTALVRVEEIDSP